jgi:dTDP-4-dehydrorhamnose reductase
MAELLKSLAHGAELPHADVLALPGWWERSDRFSGTPIVTGRSAPAVVGYAAPPLAHRPLLITGKTGALGQVLAAACKLRGLPYVLTDRATLAIDDAASVDAALDCFEPSAVINAAGFSCVNRSEEDQAACMEANATGAELLARACEVHAIPFVTFSSDQVFDGGAGGYAETDSPNPINTLGRSKAEAERRVLEAMDGALIVRSAAFFSPHDRRNFAARLLEALRRGESLVTAPERVSPTYLPDLAHAVLDLLIDRETGLWHVTNDDCVSWGEFGRRLADAAGLDGSLIETAGPGLSMLEARDTSLKSKRGALLGGVDDAIERFVREAA